jgi:hypothetical protein
MQVSNSVKKDGKILLSARAYKGDAMTLLAFDLDESILENFVGFSIGNLSVKSLYKKQES